MTYYDPAFEKILEEAKLEEWNLGNRYAKYQQYKQRVAAMTSKDPARRAGVLSKLQKIFGL